jgi:ATP-dependent protease ClpP protease subunit
MAHTYSSRTQALADGTIGGWYTVDSLEVWTGFYKDVPTANFALTAMVNSAKGRYDADLALATLAPTTVSVAGPPVTVTVTGTGFVAGSVILIAGVAVSTTFVNATTLTTSFDPTVVQNVTFKVRQPDGQLSNGLPMIVTA